MNYWAERIAKNQEKLSDKTIKQINIQLQRYYGKAMDRVIRDFMLVYDKVWNAMEEGKAPTPADLYKLDKYWEAHAQMKKELQRLGNKEIELLSNTFETNFIEAYNTIALPGESTFNIGPI